MTTEVDKKTLNPKAAGSASIGVDEVTKETLKRLAAAEGKSIVDKVRELVNNEASSGAPQAMALGVPPASISRREFEDLKTEVNKLVSMMIYFPSLPMFKFNGEDFLNAVSRGAGDLDTLEAEAMKAVKAKFNQLRQTKLPEAKLPEGNFGAVSRVSAES